MKIVKQAITRHLMQVLGDDYWRLNLRERLYRLQTLMSKKPRQIYKQT